MAADSPVSRPAQVGLDCACSTKKGAEMSTLSIGTETPIHIQTVDMRLRSSYRDTLVEKASTLFRRHGQLLGIKLNLRRNETGKAVAEYSATARLVLPGYDKIVVKRGQQLSSVISETLEVAGRQLRRRARALRAKKRG